MHSFIQFITGLVSPQETIPGKMSILLAYENLSSALWATETLNGLFRRMPLRQEPRLSPRCFSALADSEHRTRTTALAAQANVIVIAVSSNIAQLPAYLEGWLEECLAAGREANTAVAVLFGNPHHPDPADSPRLRMVQRLAEKAGCAFFAPWLDADTVSLLSSGTPADIRHESGAITA